MKFSARRPGNQTGREAEQAALDHLIEQGLTLVVRNYSCRRGEIDLIMVEDNCLVFVEVRFRKNTGYGDAATSVTRTKQKKIIIAAQHYLQNNDSLSDQMCRFDVVAISPTKRESALHINWIKDAFQIEA